MVAGPVQGTANNRQVTITPGQRVAADHSATISPYTGIRRADLYEFSMNLELSDFA
jgi:hypothetical protein